MTENKIITELDITIFRRDNPASSCNRIINDNPSARSGYYWVLTKNGVQQVVKC